MKFAANLGASAFAAAIMLAAPLAQAQAQAPALDEETIDEAEMLMDAGLSSTIGYEVVESLTTEIGPRLAGSEAEARARDWAVAKMTALGLKNVRIDPFDVPYWERGIEEAEIISPYPQSLELTALGGSVATTEKGVTGEIVRFETLADLQDAPMTGLEGKIVFVDEYMTRTQDGSGYGVAVAKRSGAAIEAGKRGAVAALIRSVGTDSHRFPHTGQMRYGEVDRKVPIAALSAPDADQLQRALERGRPVTVRVRLDTVSPGTRPSGNVIGEIPGRTDEIVVIGGHLDSWDLGTGAVDDGAGIGITMGAAKVILESGLKPERTIRIVAFGAEEIGLYGGIHYAEKYAADLDKHIVGAESDFGAGQIYQFQTRFGETKLDRAKEFQRVLAPLGIGPGNNEASGGPDMIGLRGAGVPVVTLKQNGWDYFDLHHTHDDTLDKIDPDDIAQNVAAYAAFVWMAANMDGDFRDPVMMEASQ
ncbi:M20/M25/M40 family metallo-hydrolase [Aquisalinus luteolus]|uniref:Carboxypeptidase Q n=2 Tax=Aquisalinus luteolus TaxID=1566827 RepID=A0A8J3A7N3_9PROT|nr:M20/M25/M40 family metallo-hydrolase [Aquisalinus luteolus]GGH97289.1 peptidase M28 [Aquisalinus luteolus]